VIHADTTSLGKAYTLGIQRDLTQCRERVARLEATVAVLLERVSALEQRAAETAALPGGTIVDSRVTEN
jgi:hypothetical protein